MEREGEGHVNFTESELTYIHTGLARHHDHGRTEAYADVPIHEPPTFGQRPSKHHNDILTYAIITDLSSLSFGTSTSKGSLASSPIMATSTPDINISLEPHVIETLKPLYNLLPDELAQELQQYISDAPPELIPYKVLLSVSKWSRTDGGQKALKRRRLDPSGYSMVALLAGTTTSPDRNFGVYVPPKDPEEVEKGRARERKTITALVNGVLSVGCVGFAAWWAGSRQGWQMEWVSILHS